jgi:hypothetical protein
MFTWYYIPPASSKVPGAAVKEAKGSIFDLGHWFVMAIPQRTQVSVRVHSSGYATAVAAGQSLRFNYGSGVGIFNFYWC